VGHDIMIQGDLFRIIRLLVGDHLTLDFNINGEIHFAKISYELPCECITRDKCEGYCRVFIAYMDSVTETLILREASVECKILKRFHGVIERNNFQYPDKEYSHLLELATDPNVADPRTVVNEIVASIYRIAGAMEDA